MTRQNLEKKSGTPVQFKAALEKAVGDGTISTTEMNDAYEKYLVEWFNALDLQEA